MKKKLIALSTALALAAPIANAVVLNPRGTGQVLLYPYYTVDGGNTTLLTIGNMSDQGKAVRVRFSEGHNGRPVLSFNLYLSPNDMWTGAVFSQDHDGWANLVTDDNSCMAPELKTSLTLPTLADGRRYVAFNGESYAHTTEFSPPLAYDNFFETFLGEDGGPVYPARSRDGMIEVIEMASIVPNSPVSDAITHQNEMPKNCSYVVNGWRNGLWTQNNPKTDLANPTGDLFGSAQIINVAAGTLLSYNAEALDEFRQDPTDLPRGSKNSVVMNTPSGQNHPNLSDVLTDPDRKLASASVFIDGSLIRVDYPAETQAIDAVSAVLMADTLVNDYVVEPAIGAQSEWIVTFPTKRFYTDEAIVGNAPIAPFSKSDPDQDNESAKCMESSFSVFDREENTLAARNGRVASTLALCRVVQKVNFVSQLDFILPENIINTLEFKSGWVKVNFANSLVGGDVSFPRQLRAGAFAPHPANIVVFNGLPVMGFLATNYVNNNVQQGVLANYSGIFPHRTTGSAEGTYLDF